MELRTARTKLESIRTLWVEAYRYSLVHENAQRVTIKKHKRISSATLVLAFVTVIAALVAGATKDTLQGIAFGFNLVAALATSITKLIEERSDAPNKAAIHAKGKHTLKNLCDEIDTLGLQVMQAVDGSRELSVVDVDTALSRLRVKVSEAEPRSEVDEGEASETAEREVERTSILRGLEDITEMLAPKPAPPPAEARPAPVPKPKPEPKPEPEPEESEESEVEESEAERALEFAIPLAPKPSPAAAPEPARPRARDKRASAQSAVIALSEPSFEELAGDAGSPPPPGVPTPEPAAPADAGLLPERAAGVIPVQRKRRAGPA